MRIRRAHSRLSFRRRRRGSGCFSFVMLLATLVGVGVIVVEWLEGGWSIGVNQNPGMRDDSRLASAQTAFERGDLNGAIQLARDILADQPEHAGAISLLTRALIYRSFAEYDRGGDRAAALNVTLEASRAAPGSVDILAAHAFALASAGQPGEAADVARRALEIDTAHSLARTALALAYGSVGSFDVALRESARALENAATRADQLDALRVMAVSYNDLGSYEQAARTVERALALQDNLLLLHFERALYALQVGDDDAATVAYYQVLVYDPNNVKARLRLCELSSLLREREAAVDYCQQVTRRAPAWADGWYHLGREYFLQGDFAAAQTALHQCSSLQVMQNVPVSERRFECWYLQGQAAQILGDCEALVATYNEFRAMAAAVDIQQTWTYPPEGPPGCS